MDIYSRFVEVSNIYPQNVAIDCPADGVLISYGQLKESVDALAAYFSSVCDKPRIALLFRKRSHNYPAMLAALKSGSIYCPINPDLPRDRISAILESFSPHVALCDERFDAADFEYFVDIDYAINNGSILGATSASLGEGAYVIYTSGSTGIPKGVLIGRQGLSSYLSWAITEFNVSPGARISQHPNVGFDLSVLDIYLALCSGATLCPIVSALERLDPYKAIRKRHISHWISVPSVISQLPSSIDEVALAKSDMVFIFCGEALAATSLAQLFERFPDSVVYNLYGPTEATVSCSCIRLTKTTYQEYCDRTVSIGRPIEGVTFFRETLSGDEFELVIKSHQVALGYHNDANESSVVFGSQDGIRTYRTGDLFYEKKGHLYFSRRKDRQVKHRGYRIELDEIDLFVDEFMSRACAKSVLSDEHLVTFVESDRDVDLGELRRYLAEKLPAYSIPERVIIISNFPRTSNDKIDVKLLERSVYNGV